MEGHRTDRYIALVIISKLARLMKFSLNKEFLILSQSKTNTKDIASQLEPLLLRTHGMDANPFSSTLRSHLWTYYAQGHAT